MSQLLEDVIAEVRKLPESEQDAIAAMIRNQLDEDRPWDDSFARSQDQLAKLAQKVREDIAAGRVRDLSRRRP